MNISETEITAVTAQNVDITGDSLPVELEDWPHDYGTAGVVSPFGECDAG